MQVKLLFPKLLSFASKLALHEEACSCSMGQADTIKVTFSEEKHLQYKYFSMQM